MLSIQEAYDLARRGRELPHEQYVPFPDGTEGILLDAAAALIADLGPRPDDERGALTSGRIWALRGQYGWFPVASVFGMSFAHAYQPDDVPEMGPVRGDIRDLLRVFSFAAAHEETDEGAWTVPLAMLASLDEEQALMFAGFGAVLAMACIARDIAGES